jgi:hypothetical protein
MNRCDLDALIEANRINTRCCDKHGRLSYLPKQRHGLFSTKKLLLDFIALCAEDISRPAPKKVPKKTTRFFVVAFELSIVFCSPCGTFLGAGRDLPVVTNFLISLAHRNKDHVVLFLRTTQHWTACPSLITQWI